MRSVLSLVLHSVEMDICSFRRLLIIINWWEGRVYVKCTFHFIFIPFFNKCVLVVSYVARVHF